MRKRVREPDQYAGLDKQGDGVKNSATKVESAGIDGRREKEVQDQMMQCDSCSAGDNRAKIAIGNQACQSNKEVHMHVGLPSMSPELKDKHRYVSHEGDCKNQAG